MAEFSDMTTIIKFKSPVVNIFTCKGTYILIHVLDFFGYILEEKGVGYVEVCKGSREKWICRDCLGQWVHDAVCRYFVVHMKPV